MAFFARVMGPFANRSAMRVCQPGPVARHRSMTSGGSRRLINWRGLSERGRPPLLTTARESMSSVNSGSSLYSWGLIWCASTRAMSEPKVRREACLFTIVGLSHAEHVAIRATQGVPNDYQSTFQASVADDSTFTVVLAPVFDLDCRAFEDDQGIFEVETALDKRLLSLGWIVGQDHPDSVSTKTVRNKVRALDGPGRGRRVAGCRK